MITNETQQIIIKMLLSLSSNEKECSDAKKKLINHRLYNHLNCFNRIVNKKKGMIDHYAIVDFMKVNSTYCSLSEAEYFIMINDKDLKGGLDINDLKILIGKKDKEPKNIKDKNIDDNANIDSFCFPYEIEYLLSKVFETDMNLIRDFLCYLTNLKKRFDFSADDMLNILNCREAIVKENLKQFLEKRNVQLQDKEIEMIFNKMDITKKGKITLPMLKRLFRECHQIKEIQENENNDFDQTGSTIKKGIEIATGDETMTGMTQKNTFQSTQISDTLTIKKGMSFPKGKESIKIVEQSHINYNITFDYSYYRDMVSFLSLLMDIEYEIEQLKINMTFQDDFNLCDCFTFFDQGRLGYLTERDLLTGFNLILGDIVKHEDISLLMKRYDLNRQGVLNYQDLFDMLIPFTKDNRDIMERRYSHHLTPLTFCYLTKYQLTLLLNYLVSSEQRINEERQSLSQIPVLALGYVYSHIDRKQNGYFTPNELTSFLQLSNVIFLRKECDLLFIRLDRNRDGKVTLDDIHSELLIQHKEVFC